MLSGTVLIVAVMFILVTAVLGIPVFGKSGYVVKAEFVNASQIQYAANATRTPVRVGGVEVGKVEDIEPGRTPRTSTLTMRIEEETEDFEVKRDARADIRWRRFLGGQMYVDLTPGSPEAPALDEDVLPTTRTSNQQELDDLLQLYDGGTAEAQRDMFRGLRNGFSDPPSAGRAIETASPTLRTVEPGARNARGQRDDDLRALVAATGKTVDALGRDPGALQDLVEEGDRTLAVTAANRDELGDVLDMAPSTLDSTQKTMRRLHTTLNHLDPLSVRLRPGARSIAPAARAATPAVMEAEQFMRDARPLLNKAGPTFDAVASASESGVPLLEGLDPTLERLDSELLPYLRERDARTRLRNYESLGPFFAGLDAVGANFDRVGHRSRFTVVPGRGSAGPPRTPLDDLLRLPGGTP